MRIRRKHIHKVVLCQPDSWLKWNLEMLVWQWLIYMSQFMGFISLSKGGQNEKSGCVFFGPATGLLFKIINKLAIVQPARRAFLSLT